MSTPIVVYPASILNERLDDCVPTSPEALAVAGELHEALLLSPEAVAIAANQIGARVRMFAVRDRIEGVKIVANPQIRDRSSRSKVRAEGCLSFPGKSFLVRRPSWVYVGYQDVVGDSYGHAVNGFQARVWCHEIDHLDGILAPERQAEQHA